MTWALTAGVVALIGLLVYYMRGKLVAENEKAALENSKTAEDEKIKLLENEKAIKEYDLRNKEKQALDGLTEDAPDGASFYPTRLRTNPDDLN